MSLNLWKGYSLIVQDPFDFEKHISLEIKKLFYATKEVTSIFFSNDVQKNIECNLLNYYSFY